MSVDTIGNFLTIIRNRIMASRLNAVVPYSKINENLAQILKDEGFIKNFEVITDQKVLFKKIKITLRYVDGESVIHELKRVSTPGRRIYSKIKNISPVIGGLGVSIISTSHGIMTDNKQARRDGSICNPRCGWFLEKFG